jgi:hypothetical protein
MLAREDGADCEFAFVRVDSAPRGSLTTDEIFVMVVFQGQCWDILVNFGASPTRCAGGYVSPISRALRQT